MKFGRFKNGLLIVLSLIIIAWALFAFLLFRNTLTKIETNSIENSLSSLAQSNAAQVRFAFESYINSLRITAAVLEKYDSFKSWEALDYLRQVAEIEGYTRLSIDYYSSGTSFTSDGQVVDVSRMGYLEKIKADEPFILDVTDSTMSQTPLLAVLVPLHNKDGEPIAALRCTFTTEKLTKLFNEHFFNEEASYQLVDGNGISIAFGNSKDALLKGTSFFAAIDKLVYANGFSSQQIHSAFSQGQAGFTKYSNNGQVRYASYLPVGINNWVLMMIMPEDTVKRNCNLHSYNALALTVQLIVIFSLILLYVYFVQAQAKNTARLHEKCFKVLSEQTGKVIFEWDFSKDKIICLSNFKTIFGRNLLPEASVEDAMNFRAVHEEDHEVFLAVFSSVLNGQAINNARFRVLDDAGNFLWSTLSSLVINDQRGRPFKAIGILENIDEQVRKEDALREKAEKDILTGLYNKATTETLIKEALNNPRADDAYHALMIIDVDNFKHVNDSLGHLYGDIVLASLADTLKHIFRSDDIIGRIGGDEFFVFLKGFHDLTLLHTKSNEICKHFRNTYLENQIAVKISASVGIAICPDHGTDFATLYKHADIALYTAKAKGKDMHFIFHGKEAQDFAFSRTAIDTKESIQKSFAENRLEYIFKLLYHSEDTSSAINSTLRLITNHFNFSHGYIFEFDEGGNFSSGSFECHLDESCAPSDFLQNVPLSSYTFFIKSLNERGVLVLKDPNDIPPSQIRDKLALRGIQTLLQIAIKDQGRLIGAIQFEDCEKTHSLTALELDEISTICHVLATFLIKQRGVEREQQQSTMKLSLNAINKYAYVFD